MVIRTGLYWIVLATAGLVTATGLWLLFTSGAPTPAERAAADENSKAWHAADLLCLKHYEAKWAWKRGTGSSQAEVERLAAELIAARARAERAAQVYGPIANRSQAELLAGRNQALVCFLVSGVLALLGVVGVLGARHYSAAP